MNRVQHAIETYIRAKDHNRPHLMESAFAANATLEIVADPRTIGFPPTSRGLAAISDVLVRRFAQSHENVYTFCLASPPEDGAVAFSCPWLVGMSEKESRVPRVGFGRYDWLFEEAHARLANRLSITIDVMERLAPDCLLPVMSWLSRLPYPWCPASTARERAPHIEGLDAIRGHLANVSA